MPDRPLMQRPLVLIGILLVLAWVMAGLLGYLVLLGLRAVL